MERAHQLVADQVTALNPRSILGVLGALGLIVVAGIAFPVIVMSLRWPDLTAPWRASLVAAFLLSVAGLGGYIWQVATKLDR